jgi:hypothetical protein
MTLVADPLRGLADYRSSAMVLVLANLIPLVGVLFFEWGAFSVVALYWVETVIIGLVNVAKMIVCNPTAAEVEIPASYYTPAQNIDIRRELRAGRFQVGHHVSKLILVPLFVAHFGVFCFILGGFVFAMFGLRIEPGEPATETPNIAKVVTDSQLLWPSLALAASHVFSFFRNFLGRGEYRRTIAGVLMFQPYRRGWTLMIVIVCVALLAEWLDTASTLVLTGIIVVKQFLDLAAHLREHERMEKRKEDEGQGTGKSNKAVKQQNRTSRRTS